MTPVRRRETNGHVLDLLYTSHFSPGEVSSHTPQSTAYPGGSRPALNQSFTWCDHESGNGEQLYNDAQYWDSSHSFDSEDANFESPISRRPNMSTPVARSKVKENVTPERRNEPRPKRTARAQQACENCRIKKSKCDEKSPQCTNCWEADVECKYKGTKPGKKDQIMGDMSETVKSCAKQVADVKDMVQYVINYLQPRDTLLGHDQASRHHQTTHDFFPPNPSGLASPLLESAMTASFSQEHIDQSYTGSYKIEDGMPQGILSIPFQHSTPAHKLVENWKSIRPFYRNITNTNYVMNGEWNREPLASSLGTALDGVVRIQNIICDQGDSLHLLQLCSSPQKTPIPTRLASDMVSDVRHRQLDGDGRYKSTPTNKPSEQQSYDLLQLESRRAQTLWQSFLRHIHILHPVVNTSRIQRLVENFGRCVVSGSSPSRTDPYLHSKGLSSTSLFKNGGVVIGEKRKRADESTGDVHVKRLVKEHAASAQTKRAIETAIVLLVFALGEICQSENLTRRPSSCATSSTSPIESEPPPTSTITPAASPIRFSTFQKAGLYINESMKDDEPHWCPSTSMAETPEGFISVDVNSSGVPGLTYYVAATRILGELSGSTELTCVHAMLLAGLYASQLLRPKESWKWIHSAGTAMQIILKANPHSMSLKFNDAQVNAIRIPYWTCLQLESDLLAELDFPPSGISRFEDEVPAPGCTINDTNNLSDSSIDMYSIMLPFSQQIYLRKVLNRTHTALYSTEERGWSILTSKQLLESLEDWKKSLWADNLRCLWWDESDSAATEMNTARMRAKYYGAQVIINRPFLQHILEVNEPYMQSQNTSFASDATYSHTTISDGINATRIPIANEETLSGAKRCVIALIKSTEAFDRLASMPRRLIVTNLFGTAQAQFGNILVLAAVVSSGYLQSLISISEFDRLLKRTITFIGNLAPMSETFQTHLKILQTIEDDLIPRE